MKKPSKKALIAMAILMGSMPSSTVWAGDTITINDTSSQWTDYGGSGYVATVAAAIGVDGKKPDLSQVDVIQTKKDETADIVGVKGKDSVTITTGSRLITGGIDLTTKGDNASVVGVYNSSTGSISLALSKIIVKTTGTFSSVKAYGIQTTENKGTIDITGINEISVTSEKTAYGIVNGGGTITLNENVLSNDVATKIIVDGGKNGTGVVNNANRTTTLKKIKSIEVKSGLEVYGINNSGGKVTVEITGEGGNAFTLTGSGAKYAIKNSDQGSGFTTLTLKNSKLNAEDKIESKSSNPVNIVLGDNSEWTVASDSIIKNSEVNTTVGDGGTINTQADTTGAKTIDLGSGTFTAEEGSKISFDAELYNDTVTSDKITTEGKIKGNITLGSVNITGESTDAWEINTSKETTLFERTGGNIDSNFTMAGTVTGTSDGYEYDFSQKAVGSGILTVLKKGGFTLPQYVQGQDENHASIYSLVSDYDLPAELGTLNNTGRDSFTIAGNGKTIDANGYTGGVTINSGDTMTVKDTTLTGFNQFATNAGTLNLNEVSFNNTATADVVNNGTLNLTGNITLDKGITGTGTTYINGETTLMQNGKTEVELKQDTTIQSGATLKGSDTFINKATFQMEKNATVNSNITNEGTMNIYGGSIKNLNSANANLNFYITPTDMNSEGTNTMLNVSGVADVSNSNVKAGVLNLGTDVNNGDKINLIKAGTLNADGMKTGTITDGMLEVDLDIAQEGNSIVATVGGNAGAKENTKSPVETQVAGISLLNTSSDMVATDAINSAESAVGGADQSMAEAGAVRVMMPFATIGGSGLRLKSGSYVDMKSWNINVGFAKETNNKDGKLLFGPVIEYGRGSYDSYLDNGTHGDGNSSFWGIGVIAKQSYNSGLYVDGSLRVGRMSNDYNSYIENKDMGYDNSATYYAAHVGVGNVQPINAEDSIDYYLRLFYSHQNGSSATLNSGYVYDFDSVDSWRTRLGFRYNHKINKTSSLFAGLAWQHEFGSECRATVHTSGFTAEAPAPSVQGETGILELGVKLLPNNNDKFEVDLGLNGYVGKQQGFGANAQFLWKF